MRVIVDLSLLLMNTSPATTVLKKMPLSRNFQRLLLNYSRLGLARPLCVGRASPYSHISRRLLSQTSRRQDLNDWDPNQQAQGGQDDKDDRPDYGWRLTLWRALEAAVTAAASIAMLGYAIKVFADVSHTD